MIRLARARLADMLSAFLRSLLERPQYPASVLGQAEQGASVLPGVYIDAPSNIYLGRNALINRGCQIYCASGKFIMGADSHLAGDVYVNAAKGVVSIGAGVAIGPKVIILSHSNAVVRDVPIVASRHTADVTIGDDVFIGAASVVLPGIRVDSHAVIAAGSIVNRDVPAKAIYAGVPAKQIGLRDAN